MANARKIAVQALMSVNSDGAYSNITLNKILNEKPVENNDKALASAIFYGVLDRRITIDFVISQFIKTPLLKIRPFTLEVLRSAVYQLMFMDKIPASAAVNEAVKLIKSSKERYNASFVNALLRNIIRAPIELPSDNGIASLSIRFSCPEWIIEGFIKDYGIDNAVALLEQSLKSPPVTLHVNTLKINTDELIELLYTEGINSIKCDIENALVIKNGIDAKNSVAYNKGFFHIQDLASQITVSHLNLQIGERVLDICSAPGGKSFTMAEVMKNNGEIAAFDLYESRVSLISEGAKRLGIDIIKASIGDAEIYNDKLGLFDAVLCDVPCSGFGVIRRKPEIKYKTQRELISLEKIQLNILNNAANYLKPGGRMIYSTCTLRKSENECIVNTFLDKHSDYELKYEHTYMPHIDGTDGFYCALIYKSR